MEVTRVGVDIAKSVFHVRGVDRRDRPLASGLPWQYAAADFVIDRQ